MTAAPTSGSTLPSELSGTAVLVVVAHPDDESFGLGAVLAAMTEAGTLVEVLCLTRGEASTLGGDIDLAHVRRAELADAARQLGIHHVHLDDFSDGGLSTLAEEILDEAVDRHRGSATALVTFEPGGVTGHPDHRAAAAAAERAAARHGLALVEWGVAPDVAAPLRRETGVPFTALHGPGVIELVVDRTRQRAAIASHASQATANPVLVRRLELQQNRERLRIRRPTTG